MKDPELKGPLGSGALKVVTACGQPQLMKTARGGMLAPWAWCSG
jgi:hypothetical protein